MRVFLIALSICVSSAAFSAVLFTSLFQNNTTYSMKKAPVEAPLVETVATPPTVDLAALSQKGMPSAALWNERARGAYRVPVPRQNPFDQIVSTNELTAVSGNDLSDQSAAVGLKTSTKLAKEQLDGIGDNQALITTGAITPEALDAVVVDPAAMGILGVILDAARNGGQNINNNVDVGTGAPSIVTIGE